MPTFLITQNDDTNETYFQRQTRTYNNDDILKIKCTIAPRVNAFKDCFFYRSHSSWNLLPLEIREIEDPDCFKTMLEKHLWLIAQSSLDAT